jgi:Ca-activated chloride channel family protein
MYLTFENPIYLWFLFAIPLFIISHFFFLRRSKSKAIKFANFEALQRVSGDKLITKNMTLLILRIMIIFCLVIAAAGTTYWYKGKSNNISYVVALDVSASMTSEDIKPTRFEAAKEYIRYFADSFDSRTKLGLVTFSGVTTIELYPLDSKLEFDMAVNEAEVLSTGGTDIPGAIITSTNMLLAEREAGRAILLVSDGINTMGAFISESMTEAVEYAKNNQVVIYTVGVGSDAGPLGYLPEYYNISSYYNEELLEYVSNETGGKYVYAEDSDQLMQAFDFLKLNVDDRYLDIDLSFGALLLSLGLLFVEWGLSNTVYRRII